MPIVLVKVVLWEESKFLTCSHHSDMHNVGESDSTNQYVEIIIENCLLFYPTRIH